MKFYNFIHNKILLLIAKRCTLLQVFLHKIFLSDLYYYKTSLGLSQKNILSLFLHERKSLGILRWRNLVMLAVTPLEMLERTRLASCMHSLSWRNCLRSWFIIITIIKFRLSHRRCSIKMLLLKISQYSQGNTCVLLWIMRNF